MSENSMIEMEFQRLKTRVEDVGGRGSLSTKEYVSIERFCREQNPECPRCGKRNTKFRYMENKGKALTLQPRYRYRICKVPKEKKFKEKEFIWGGKQYREKVTEQLNIHQTQNMPSDGGSWGQNTAGIGETTGLPSHEPDPYSGPEVPKELDGSLSHSKSMIY